MKNLIKRNVRKMIRSGSDYLYHRAHKYIALERLKTVEKEKGKTNPKFIQLSNEYAQDVLGSLKYAPWLYAYSAMAGEFKEGWIPDNFYGKVVVPKITGAYRTLSGRKLLVDSLLNNKNTLDICYYVNELFWNTDYKVLDKEGIRDFLFQKNERVVYKLENSMRGQGIYFFTKENFKAVDIKKLGNGVFQTYIDQHSFFSTFTNLSVATIRITSICDDSGNILVKAAFLRVGQNNDTHVNSVSEILIPINLNDGKLVETGYISGWISVTEHPNSKIIFKNKKIPFFQNCIAEVIRMHSLIPFVRCIGWDVIVDSDNNFRLIEWNAGHNSIRISEATQGPCFKELSWEKLK